LRVTSSRLPGVKFDKGERDRSRHQFKGPTGRRYASPGQRPGKLRGSNIEPQRGGPNRNS